MSRPRRITPPKPEPPQESPPSRADRGYRRLRALPRLAIPERPVQIDRAVEPCAEARESAEERERREGKRKRR